MSSRQRLVHVVMGVHETRHDDVPVGVEHPVDLIPRLPATGDKLGDRAVLDDNAAAGSIRKAGERIAYPGPHQLFAPDRFIRAA
jgi:hypothetical protein